MSTWKRERKREIGSVTCIAIYYVDINLLISLQIFWFFFYSCLSVKTVSIFEWILFRFLSVYIGYLLYCGFKASDYFRSDGANQLINLGLYYVVLFIQCSHWSEGMRLCGYSGVNCLPHSLGNRDGGRMDRARGEVGVVDQAWGQRACSPIGCWNQVDVKWRRKRRRRRVESLLKHIMALMRGSKLVFRVREHIW